jgi:hypothetical protein
MSQDFVLATLTFTIVMVMFSIIKDYYIIPKFNPSNKKLERLNRRWYISFIVGVVLLYIVYGRGSP